MPLVDSSLAFSRPLRPLYNPFKGIAEQALGLDAINRLYDACKGGSPEEFAAKCLRYAGLRWKLPEARLDALRSRPGGIVVVANHPLGAPEALLVMLLLSRLRPDYRLMSNFVLGSVPEVRSRLLLVDPFQNPQSASKNLAPLRQSLAWLKNGGALGLFPAGEVSAWRFDERRVADCDWQPQAARLARATGASVLPVWFSGSNGLAFQLAGLIHPRLRTLLIPRALFKVRGGFIRARVGTLIPPDEIRSFGSPRALSRHLRQRVYDLKN